MTSRIAPALALALSLGLLASCSSGGDEPKASDTPNGSHSPTGKPGASRSENASLKLTSPKKPVCAPVGGDSQEFGYFGYELKPKGTLTLGEPQLFAADQVSVESSFVYETDKTGATGVYDWPLGKDFDNATDWTSSDAASGYQLEEGKTYALVIQVQVNKADLPTYIKGVTVPFLAEGKSSAVEGKGQVTFKTKC